MPKPIRIFVRTVNTINRYIGLVVMYGVFAMIGVLLYSSIVKTFFIPPLWTLETTQFMMVAYFLLGGAYSMQIGAHVRMDLLYGHWSARTKAIVDSFTILFLIFYLIMLLYGGISSTEYALQYGETSYSAWAPYMAPIKIIMAFGIFMMLLQAIATLFENIAEALGKPLP